MLRPHDDEIAREVTGALLLAAVVLVASCSVFKAAKGQELPQQTGPLGVAPTAAEIELGKQLFFDGLLSEDGTISCATCHNPARGWTDGLPVAVGIRGQAGTRNTPTIINSSYVPLHFWDARTIGGITQATLPTLNPIEMGNQTNESVLLKLTASPRYIRGFAQVYASAPSTILLARALAAFQSTVISRDAPIDRRLAGDVNALTPEAEVGFQIFLEANCMACHKPPLFTDNLTHNTGMEYAGKLRITDEGRFTVLGRDRAANLVRAGAQPSTIYRAFKTPSLREVQLTGPYGHAGTFASIEQVVDHYASGGARFDATVDRFTDPRVLAMRNLDWSLSRRFYLSVFLKQAFRGVGHQLREPLP